MWIGAFFARKNGIVYLRARAFGHAKAQSDFNAFEGLNAQNRCAQAGIQAGVPLGKGAQTNGTTEDMHFRNPTHGVLVHFGLTYAFDHRR